MCMMGLCYVIVIGVVCDDLFDGGVWLYVVIVCVIKEFNLLIGVELLIFDFNGELIWLVEVFEFGLEVLVYNVEIVFCIFKWIWLVFMYWCSLGVFIVVCDVGLVIKSNFIFGLGEIFDEVCIVLGDLCDVGCDIVIII